jgi:transcriptional regulator with XRE-family HTH domain
MEVTAGDRLKQRREELELTQRQVSLRMEAAARDVGERIPAPAKSTISCWETGRRIPTPFYALLLCRALRSQPDALGLERVLTEDRLAELSRTVNDADGVVVLAERSPGAPEPPRIAANVERVDWERLNWTLRTMRRVDRWVVEDQWILTRHYLDELHTLTSRSHLDVITAHLGRLQQLRSVADDQGLKHELGLMLCQSAVCAGVGWTAQTDYGLAMEAYQYCTDLAADLSEPSLRAVGLVMQAQLYGGRLHSRLPRLIQRQRQLLDEVEDSTSRRMRGDARQLIGSIAALLHAEFGHEPAAMHSIEAAKGAESEIDAEAGRFCGLVDPLHRLTIEGLLESMFGRPENGIQLLSTAIARTDPAWGWRGQRAWLALALGTCYARTGAADLAAPSIADAVRLAREHETPFLMRAAEAAAEGLVAAAHDVPAVQALREQLRIA